MFNCFCSILQPTVHASETPLLRSNSIPLCHCLYTVERVRSHGHLKQLSPMFSTISCIPQCHPSLFQGVCLLRPTERKFKFSEWREFLTTFTNTFIFQGNTTRTRTTINNKKPPTNTINRIIRWTQLWWISSYPLTWAGCHRRKTKQILRQTRGRGGQQRRGQGMKSSSASETVRTTTDGWEKGLCRFWSSERSRSISEYMAMNILHKIQEKEI